MAQQIRPVLRIEANGRVFEDLASRPRETFNLSEISDPFGFFLERLYRMRVTGALSSDVPLSYDYCNADVTHNCNLRCHFCCSDFSDASNVRMSDENFIKLTQIAPLVDDRRVFLSCLYEPYLHPKFTDLLAMLPAASKGKYFFTTNLAVKILSVDQITALAKANVSLVNISMDTSDPSLFEQFRVNSKHSVFASNLEKLTKIFSLHPQAPPLTFITMALKSNIGELEALSRRVYEGFGLPPDKVSHEIRMAFPVNHMDKDWAAREILSKDEWFDLFARFKKWPYRIVVLNQTYDPSYIGHMGGTPQVLA